MTERAGALVRVRTVLLPPALAVLFAVTLCAGALLVSGDSPLAALSVMITQVGEGTTAVDIVNSGAIYYIVGLAAAIGFQMKLFNIGLEGQFRLAAAVAAIVGGSLALPAGLHALVVILVGIAVGAVWAGIPALLKAYRGVSEVISTIMLNFVATGLIAYLITPGTFGVLRGNNISTQPIPESGQVPGLSFGASGEVFGLVLLAALLGVGYWFLLGRTRFGFELRASGESPTAPELLGRDHAYTLTSPQGYGFVGLAVALLGRNHPVGVAAGALVWAFLDKSALALDNIGVPREIVLIMQGSIVLSVVVAYEIVRRYGLAAEQRRVAALLRAENGARSEVPS